MIIFFTKTLLSNDYKQKKTAGKYWGSKSKFRDHMRQNIGSIWALKFENGTLLFWLLKCSIKYNTGWEWPVLSKGLFIHTSHQEGDRPTTTWTRYGKEQESCTCKGNNSLKCKSIIELKSITSFLMDSGKGVVAAESKPACSKVYNFPHSLALFILCNYAQQSVLF